jgi:hypothetical protein
MYVATLVFVIIGNMTLFRAFLAADVVIPVVLWVLRIFINIGKPDNSEFDEAVKNNSEEKNNPPFIGGS